MTKILITTGSNSLNKGEMAMVISTVSLMRKLSPDATFDIMSKRFEVDRERYERYNLNIIKQTGHKKSNSNLMTLLLTGGATFSAFCCAILSRILKTIGFDFKCSSISVLRQHDIIVDLSGDCFTEDYGIVPFLHYLSPLLMGIILKKDVVIYAQSIGPFKSTLMKFIGKFVLNRCRIVTVRDNITKNYLQGIGFNNFNSTADSAFLLDPEYTERTKNILQNIDKPIVGICISQSIIRYSDLKNHKNAYDTHISMITKVIDYITEQIDANVLLIPHVYDTEDGHDDRLIERICLFNAKNKNKIKLIEDEYTPGELKGMIGQCDLFIGSRMHATIAATSLFVPTIAIAYSHKTHGIIGEMLGQEKYVLDIKDLSYELLISKIDDAWENRDRIKEELKEKIPSIKEKSMLNGKLVKELLDTLGDS